MNKIFFVFIFCTTLTACEFSEVEREAGNFLRKLKALVGLEVATVESLPGRVADAKTSPTPVAPGLAKAHSEILYEMMSVVFDVKEISDKSEFGNLAHTLNEGASLEGIYRGIILGSRYRVLEGQSRGSSPNALKAFALELAELQVDMKNPTRFKEGEANKPLEIDFPDENSAAKSVSAISSDQDSEQPKLKAQEIALENLKLFMGASVFTLKRVLCDEALKKIDEFQTEDGKADVGALAQWYSKFANRMAEKNIDFGLEQRNKSDFDFHFKWAQTMSTDRVKWEVLNRYHRYMNGVSKVK